MLVSWTPRFRIWGFLALIAITAVLLAVMRPTPHARSGLPSSSMPELGTLLPGDPQAGLIFRRERTRSMIAHKSKAMIRRHRLR